MVSTTHVCNWHKDTGFTYTFGVEIPTPDVAYSGTFLLWGHNPSSTSLILAHDIVAARKRGMKIVAVDPRRVGIAAQADVLLQVRPGADGALALAMIDVVIQEKLYDEAFVRQWTNGWLLLRDDTGLALTEVDLTSAGSAERFVAWDEISDAPVIYDPASGGFKRTSIRPALFGKRSVRLQDGREISCVRQSAARVSSLRHRKATYCRSTHPARARSSAGCRLLPRLPWARKKLTCARSAAGACSISRPCWRIHRSTDPAPDTSA